MKKTKKSYENKISRINRQSDTLVLTDVNIIDVLNRAVHESSTIICREGKISEIGPSSTVAIPENATVIKLSGRYIIPGLIDAHVHLAHPGVDDYGRISTESMKKKYLRHSYLTLKSGVTTIRNMPGSFGYSILKFRDQVNKGIYIGPRIYASGPALAAPYGYFSLKRFIPAPPVLLPILSIIFGAHGLSIDVDSPLEVQAIIKKLKKTGVDFIKTTTPGTSLALIENDPESRDFYIKRKVDPRLLDASMKPEVLKAITKCAHDEGLKVSAHLICLPADMKQAVEAGVDSIEHTPLGLIDDETFKMMKDKGVYWVPTAYCYYHWVDIIDNPEQFSREEVKEAIPEPYHSIGKRALEKAREAIISEVDPIWTRFHAEMTNYKQEYFPVNFKNAIKCGVKIVAGVDAGMGGAGYVPHGFLHKEMEIFVEHGMDEYEAIRTATVNAAELLGATDELGSIDQGKKADIVILKSNPLENISNLRQIEFVIKDGKIVYGLS
ncbi:MAG TPA: amidohydrolase family protein [Lachnospiraceae bacterium]|nr:amidohydrolase family protein [Lachnospiraceae bacterium]